MNGWLGCANGIAERWASGMWSVVWQSALLAGVVFVATRAWRRAPASARFWLWMLVPLRLLAMPLLTVSLPLLPAPPVTPTPASQVLSAAVTPAPGAEAVPVAIADVAASSPGPLEPGASRASVRPCLWAWLMMAWLAGVAFFLFRLARGWLQAHRTVAGAREAEGQAVAEAVQRAAGTVGLRRPPRVLVTDESVSPFVSGVVRPVVVLPAKLVERVSTEELCAVVAHEFAHVRRQEAVLGWVVGFCQVFYFFHPFFHLAKRSLLFERECACDDWVLALGGAGRGAYARALVVAAEACASGCRNPEPAVAVAESFHDLERRLTLLGSAEKRSVRLSRAAVCVLLLLTAVAIPGVGLAARPANAAEPAGAAEQGAGEKAVTVTVTGQVTDKETQKPIAGARVRGHLTVWRNQGPELFDRSPYAETTTDSAGQYRLAFVTPLTTSGPMKGKDGICVDASAPGYETRPQYAASRVSPEKTEYTDVNVALDSGHRLHGKVVDEDGRPLAGAVITVENGLNGDWEYFGSLGRTQTDSAGEFELSCSLDPQTITSRAWLFISKEGYGAGYVTDILKKDDLGTVVIPRGGTVTGRVVDAAGRSVPNCSLLAYRSHEKSAQAVTDAEGRYELKGIPGEQVFRDFYTWKVGSYNKLWATFNVYARANPEMRLNEVPHYDVIAQGGEMVTGPDLVVGQEVHVSGRLLPAKGGPALKGMLVRLDTDWGNMVEANEEGRFRFPYVSPGKHRLTAYLATNLRYDPGIGHTDIAVEKGTSLDGVAIQLEPLGEVRVRFADAEGKPLAGVTAGATWSKSGAGAWTEGTKSGPDGRAVLYLSPDQVQYVRGFQHEARDPLVAQNFVEVKPVAGGVIEDIRIVMVPPSGLRGRAVSQAGEPLAAKAIAFRLEYEGGEAMDFGSRTDAQGGFQLQRLAPGVVRLSARTVPLEATGSLSSPVKLASGAVAEVGDLTLRAVDFHSVTGRLLPSPTLASLEGFKIRVDLESWEPLVPTDAEGRFVLPKVPDGQHRLTAYLPFNLRTDRGVGHVNIEVKGGDVEDVQLQLETLATVHLRIEDESGQPLEGISAAAWWTADHSGVFTEGAKSDKEGRATLYLYPGDLQYVGAHDWDGRYSLKSHQEMTPKAGDVVEGLRVVMVRPAGQSSGVRIGPERGQQHPLGR